MIAEYIGLARMAREDQFASGGAVFDLKISFSGLRQRPIRRIEQPAPNLDRQFVAQVAGAGEERQLSFCVAAFEHGLPFALVVQDRGGDSRRITSLFYQLVELIARALL